MDKLSNIINKKEKESIYNIKDIDEWLKIISIDDKNFIKECDTVACLVYFEDENKILLRREPLKSWNYRRKDESIYYLSVVTGSIEENETVENCIRRELYEETGIVLNEFYDIDIEGPFFKSKNNTSYYYTSLIILKQNEYKIFKSIGDKSEFEKLSSNVFIDVKYIDDLQIHDLITQYLITKLKQVLKK